MITADISAIMSNRLHTRIRQLGVTALLLGPFAILSTPLFAAADSSELHRGNWSVLFATGGDSVYTIDNNIGSRWTTQTKQYLGPALTQDLRFVQNVDRIVMVMNNDQSGNQDYPRGYEVHVSFNGMQLPNGNPNT